MGAGRMDIIEGKMNELISSLYKACLNSTIHHFNAGGSQRREDWGLSSLST